MDTKELRCSEYSYWGNRDREGPPTTLRNRDAANTLILKILEILLENKPTIFLNKIGAVSNRAYWVYDCAVSNRAYQ